MPQTGAKNPQFLNVSIKFAANPGGCSGLDMEEPLKNQWGLQLRQRLLAPPAALAPMGPDRLSLGSLITEVQPQHWVEMSRHWQQLLHTGSICDGGG